METDRRMPVSTKIALKFARFALAIAGGVTMLITASGTFAAGGKTNNGAPSTTATFNGPSNDVRDHRGQHSGPPPPKPLTPHRRCGVNPYSGNLENCSGVTIRDHR
jgi:hypothetical protein